MTIGERGQHLNISREQRFMNSNEQNGKVDGCKQKQLLISEVQWDPQNKQWRVTGQQQYDAGPENVNDPCKRVRHRRREKVEDKTLIEQRLLENGANKMEKNSAGGLDHLLILADSAELLSGSVNNYSGVKDSRCRVSNPNVHQLQDGRSTHAPSGEKCKKKPLDTSGGLHYVKADALPSDGRIRLTHLRHYARTRNHQRAQESGECVRVDPEGSFLDSQHLDKVDIVRYQNGEDGTQQDRTHKELEQMHGSVNGGSQIIDFRQPPPPNGQQQLMLPHHLVSHQPVQMTNGALLWNEILKGQCMKQHLSTLQPETFDGFQFPLHEPESEKDSKLIAQERQKLWTHLRENLPDKQQVQAALNCPKLVAKERRKLRKHRRKRQPEEQLVEAAQQSYVLPGAQMHQMYDAGQQWNCHMWNFQNWKMWEIEQQKLLHNAGKSLKPNCEQTNEDMHVIGGSQSRLFVTGASPGNLQLGKHNNSKESTIVEFQRDEYLEHRNHDEVKACMKPVGSSAKGRTRVSHLKREARLKNEYSVESKQAMLLPVSSSN